MADLDHRFMTPPFLRMTSRRRGADGTDIYVWDLRVGQPNVSHVAMNVVHSLEHFLGSQLRAASNDIIAVAPMGCQTGFYIVTCGAAGQEDLAALLSNALQAVLDATEVPLANPVQCGWAENHSLAGAKEVAGWLLRRRSEWFAAESQSQ